MDLYRKGDFTTEKKPIWCAPAAMQTMINIMSPGADTSRATQKLLHTIARKLGPAPDRGSEPEGMARTLASLDYGAYRVIVVDNRSAAYKAAARAIRLTGRPVALLVWRGAHNWVVSGFRSTADPALGDAFKVTHLWIEDVWYPRISDIWGHVAAARQPGRGPAHAPGLPALEATDRPLPGQGRQVRADHPGGRLSPGWRDSPQVSNMVA